MGKVMVFLERRRYLSQYESCEGMLSVEIWRTTVQGRGNSKCKGPEGKGGQHGYGRRPCQLLQQ